MATGTVNSNPSGPGVNKQTPIGQAKQSNNAWLGIEDRVAGGTTGARPDMSARYGGDASDGQFFKGNSTGVPSGVARQLNAGLAQEKPKSAATGQYGPGSGELGTFAARENMPKYGGSGNSKGSVGKLFGDGVGSTPSANPDNQYKKSNKTQPGQDLVAGTNEDKNRNMPKALRGVGKAGKRGARM